MSYTVFRYVAVLLVGSLMFGCNEQEISQEKTEHGRMLDAAMQATHPIKSDTKVDGVSLTPSWSSELNLPDFNPFKLHEHRGLSFANVTFDYVAHAVQQISMFTPTDRMLSQQDYWLDDSSVSPSHQGDILPQRNAFSTSACWDNSCRGQQAAYQQPNKSFWEQRIDSSAKLDLADKTVKDESIFAGLLPKKSKSESSFFAPDTSFDWHFSRDQIAGMIVVCMSLSLLAWIVFI
ncbi:hypothetical protein L9G74_17820 [Shewanella sp. C32]|uniref:Lipoprotein n=1 Tax=Shewanella electrica TaxID=515560 RepID=A0ABT2FQU8_9GAMM|nr:hypothetical protein [Shewanella electrica]MCH1926681.1 hypothetical protein [Shewanella electrica]MCS4558302.1 hypothetical protein [Shewanella electrica]